MFDFIENGHISEITNKIIKVLNFVEVKPSLIQYIPPNRWVKSITNGTEFASICFFTTTKDKSKLKKFGLFRSRFFYNPNACFYNYEIFECGLDDEKCKFGFRINQYNIENLNRKYNQLKNKRKRYIQKHKL